MERMAIGVDIGGTNLKMGLVSSRGQIIADYSIPLPLGEDNKADLAFISQQVANFILTLGTEKDRLAGVGIASPGIVDSGRGIVNDAVNLGWHQVPLAAIMQLFGVGNVIIGGGFSQADRILLDPVRKTVMERIPSSNMLNVHIAQAAFPTTAGIIGAAALLLSFENEVN
ncbi:ROK family protein [Paenibacillus lignilyticus]|uniref:ROK family protein n=1 Tax=Paenibacillus lignilyticus TaxID=1172615 RepID=A0ABS5CJ80_9BACL|nr:ROK family protein [Paenibacillus lignilyticus]MBP3965874.1 ROK family protein [Paenibacillus lignilyticus]